jgi:hypothetical protein
MFPSFSQILFSSATLWPTAASAHMPKLEEEAKQFEEDGSIGLLVSAASV